MPKWKMTPVSPVSVGLEVPDRVVSNAELCESLDSTPEWIERKTGIQKRHYLRDDEDITGMTVSAAEKALGSAGIEAHEIDVLVVATTTPDWVVPSMSAIVANELGVTTPRLMDITQHACASSVYAIYAASCMLQEPGLETALVVCPEGMSRITDPYERSVRIFFGDAAGAVALRKSEAPDGLLSYDLGNSYSSAVAMASQSQLYRERVVKGQRVSTPYLQMDGKVVWQEATTRLPTTIKETLAAAGVDITDVSGVALHQASAKLVEHIGRSLGASSDRVPITADTLGNTGAASPLTALWSLVNAGLAKRGDIIVLGAIGAGFLWGSLCFKLPADINIE